MTLLKAMFTPTWTQQKMALAWMGSGATVTLIGGLDCGINTLTDFNSGITVNGATGQFTIPAGNWLFHYMCPHTWTGNGIAVGSKFGLYNVTDAAFVSNQASYYNINQPGYQNTTINSATLTPFGLSYISQVVSKVYVVRFIQYLHTPGPTLNGFAATAAGGSWVTGALIMNTDP